MARISRLLPAVLLAFACATAGADEVKTFLDYQRAALAKDRDATVAANLQLTPDEAGKFWPLYQEYAAERGKLSEKLFQLIREYADAYNASRVTDADGVKLTDAALGIESARIQLKAKYMARFERILPGRKYARYYQIETRLDNLIS
ncbi:MAG TPA: hypothetical protein VF104_06285, partial [Burkholderiales bacterium]